MGLFEFLKRKSKDVIHKPLPLPGIVLECGMCDAYFEYKDLFNHWLKHKQVTTTQKVATPWGAMRSKTVVRYYSAVFAIHRPDYPESYEQFNLQILTANYFSYATLVLKQENPHMLFQYVPVAIGGYGYLKTLLVMGDWSEVVEE